jgi:putative ABC transport system permease protein
MNPTVKKPDAPKTSAIKPRPLKPTALALKNLVADWRRLALGVSGVAFATVLMFMQNGFRNALLDSPVQLLQKLDCDLIGISIARFSLPTDQTFPASLVERSLSNAMVQTAKPMFLERVRAQVRVPGNPRRPIRVVALEPEPGWFNDEQIESQLPKLHASGTALLDQSSRSTYGFAIHDPEQLTGQVIELSDQRIRMVGLVRIGTDFANDGTLLLSRNTFRQYFPMRAGGNPTAEVDLALFKLKAGANSESVAAQLTALDPRLWSVMPREALIRREIEFWNRQTPIGMIFFVGSIMGFAVGVIICYQVLFTSIHDSLPEFATLKAMGYSNGYFVWLVMKQATYLALMGFVPAFLVSGIIFEMIQVTVGLPMLFTLGRVLLVLGLTTAMCLISGLLALRRLLSADPASLF